MAFQLKVPKIKEDGCYILDVLRELLPLATVNKFYAGLIGPVIGGYVPFSLLKAFTIQAVLSRMSLYA